MSQLQLYIYKSRDSSRMLCNFNAEASVQMHVSATAAAMRAVDYDSEEKYLLYMVSYLRGGALLSIFRTIAGVDGDFLGTVLYVPAEVDIDTPALAHMVKRISRMVSNPSVSDADMAELSAMMSEEYGQRPFEPYRASASGGYGVCRYGGDSGVSFDELLAQARQGDGWWQYAGVLLVDEQLPVEVDATVVGLSEGYEEPESPGNTELFESSENFDQSDQSEHSRHSAAPSRLNIYRFELPVSSAALGSPIHFEIHTRRVLGQSPIDGYRVLGDIAEGAAKTNYLEYSPAKRRGGWLPWLGGALAGLIVGIAATWLLSASQSPQADEEPAALEQVPVATTQPAPAPAKTAPVPAKAAPAKPAAPVTPEALRYLEDNTTWTRQGLEGHPSLAGLFDDLNNYNFDALTGRWHTALAKSGRFAKVAHHATESRRKKIFKAQPPYCTDNAIAVQTYINTIDPARK